MTLPALPENSFLHDVIQLMPFCSPLLSVLLSYFEGFALFMKRICLIKQKTSILLLLQQKDESLSFRDTTLIRYYFSIITSYGT